VLSSVGPSVVHQLVQADRAVDVSVLSGQVLGVGIHFLNGEVGAHRGDVLMAKFFRSIHVISHSSRNQ
jgi:hypothetical protein